ncbi:protein Wnt [Caerostris darwini]|uniref:Protein Wnt n=1 Tax=Caerostris darwini TaxID=1538125 RepID=A0AAV4W7D8_9ARAC|nr:protein Wnt [Caerostris darwini]
MLLVTVVNALENTYSLYSSNVLGDDTCTKSILIGIEKNGTEKCPKFRWNGFVDWTCRKASFILFSPFNMQIIPSDRDFLHAVVISRDEVISTRKYSLRDLEKCRSDELTKVRAEPFDFMCQNIQDDHVGFGNRIARVYLDDREIGKDLKSLISLINGRMEVLFMKSIIQEWCICHGFSGSCTTKTCWMKVQDIHKIRHQLNQMQDLQTYPPIDLTLTLEYTDCGDLLKTSIWLHIMALAGYFSWLNILQLI